MRVIKLGLISFIMFFLLITVISLFIPSRVRISKAINIAAPKDSILNYIDDFHKWEEWNPFVTDTSIKLRKISEDGEQMQIDGTVIKWKDKKTDLRTADMTTGGLRAIESVFNTISYSASDSVTVQWYLNFRLRWYPWEKFSSLMLEKTYGPPMEKGLSNLKHELED